MTTSALRPGRAGEAVCLLLTAALPVAGYAALYGSAGYLWTLGAALVAGVLAAALAVFVARGQGWRAFVGARLGFVVVIAVAWVAARPHRGSDNPLSEVVHGLSAIMTLNQPVDLANDVLILPFLLTCVSIGLGLLALRSHSLLLPLLPPGLALTGQLLLCAGYGGPLGIAWGMGAFTVAAVMLVGLRKRDEAGPGQALAGPEAVRLATIAVAVGVVAGGTAVTVTGTGGFDPRDRWHPADVELHVTPLAFVRSDLTGPDEARFSITIDGADRVQLIPVARLDVFDGTAWTADPRFRTAGRVLRPDSASAPQITANVKVTNLPTALLPQVGRPVELQRDGTTGGSVLLDRASGMLQARSTPAAWAYTLHSTDSPRAAGTTPLPTTQTCSQTGDSPIAALRQEWLPQQTVTATMLDDLAIRMRTQLPYNPAAPAGSSLAAIQRVLSGQGPEHVGYAEQHAAAFSFLACEAGSPARVVVGYRSRTALIPGVATAVTAHNAHAWSEVYVAGRGWMTFDPTDPDKPVTALLLEPWVG